MKTEARNPRSFDLDRLPAVEVVALMNREEQAAFDAVDAATVALAEAAEQVRATFEGGGRTILLGAGTSGRLAVQEVAEIPPTFGVADDRFVALIAGGARSGLAAVTHTEDDVEAGPRALDELSCGPGDVVIGLAASGTTPFVVSSLRHAAAAGAWTCGLANNADTPLATEPDLGIVLDSGPEVVTGSTRLKAGTTQKLALNRITTTAMVLAGRVISNHMVEVRPSNDKLRLRCIRIVADLAEVDLVTAEELLDRAAGSIRAALAEARMP